MAEKHPDELELLSYVEEELAGDQRHEVVEHLVACRSCSERVRRLEAARAILRAAPPLELSDERRQRMLAALPERREPWRLFRPVRRALVIAAPIAAAAALVGVFVVGGTQLGGGGDDDSAGEGAAAETSMDMQRAEDDSGGAEEAAPTSEGVLVRNVAGPASAVVELLRAEGISAEVNEDGSVTAQGEADDVRAALTGRPGGAVAVYVR